MSISKAFSRRPLLSAIAGMALACALPLAHAQAAFPSKPITMVVPYPAGGANDMLGRLIGQKMGEALGGTAVVDNKPGAGALLGAGVVARAPADGHTLLVGGLATHAASPNLLKADYDPLKDFEPIGMIGSAPIIVITATDSPCGRSESRLAPSSAAGTSTPSRSRPGIGLPYGDVVGLLRTASSRRSTLSLITCSQRQASSWTSSHGRPMTSTSSRSARRCLRITATARRRPFSVS